MSGRWGSRATDKAGARDAAFSEQDKQRANESGSKIYLVKNKSTGQEVVLNAGQIRNLSKVWEITDTYKPVPIKKEPTKTSMQDLITQNYFKHTDKNKW